MQKNLILTFLFLLCFIPTVSLANGIYFESSNNNLTLNEDFLVQVFLDADDKSVNAVEGTVLFPSEILDLKEVRDGNSSVNFWIEKPHSLENGKIDFSGITTGGILGSKKFLFGLVFHAKSIGKASISLKNAQILENDGLGTQIPITEKTLTFFVSKGASGKQGDLSITDNNPPEDFVPFVSSDSSIFNGKHFVVFSTVDKGTGVDHYEVRESSWVLFGMFGGTYIKAESPYLLTDQSLENTIYIKAVDKAGNERVVKVQSQNNLGLLKECLILGILLAICILLCKKIWRKFIS